MDDFVIPAGSKRKVYRYCPNSKLGGGSLVWNYFGMYKKGDDYDKSFTICFLCGEKLSYPPDRSTSRQRGHIQKEHREIWDEKFPGPVTKRKAVVPDSASKPSGPVQSKSKRVSGNLPKVAGQTYTTEIRYQSENWKSVIRQLNAKYLRPDKPRHEITAIRKLLIPEVEKIYREKKEKQEAGDVKPIEETVYCLASDCEYSEGIKCSGKQPSVLGDSRKGFHFSRHPDLLILMNHLYGGEESCELLQCKISVTQKMAVDITTAYNPITPVFGHEAHVSFRRARPEDSLIESWNKSQIFVYDFNDDGQLTPHLSNALPEYLIRIQCQTPCVALTRLTFRVSTEACTVTSPYMTPPTARAPPTNQPAFIVTIKSEPTSPARLGHSSKSNQNTVYISEMFKADVPGPSASRKTLVTSKLNPVVRLTKLAKVHTKLYQSHKERKNHSAGASKNLDKMFTGSCNIDNMQRAPGTSGGNLSGKQGQGTEGSWLHRLDYMFDPNFSFTSATTESDSPETHEEESSTLIKMSEQTDGNSSPNSTLGQPEGRAKPKRPLAADSSSSCPVPLKKLRTKCKSRSSTLIVSERLVRKAKQIKLGMLFRSQWFGNDPSVVSDTKVKREDLIVHNICPVENIEDSSIADTFEKFETDGPSAIDSSNGGHFNSEAMPPEETWLPSIMSYWLAKELEEAKQSADRESSVLTNHLTKTLAYFEERMKVNDSGLNLKKIQEEIATGAKQIATNEGYAHLESKGTVSREEPGPSSQPTFQNSTVNAGTPIGELSFLNTSCSGDYLSVTDDEVMNGFRTLDYCAEDKTDMVDDNFLVDRDDTEREGQPVIKKERCNGVDSPDGEDEFTGFGLCISSVFTLSDVLANSSVASEISSVAFKQISCRNVASDRCALPYF